MPGVVCVLAFSRVCLLVQNLKFVVPQLQQNFFLKDNSVISSFAIANIRTCEVAQKWTSFFCRETPCIKMI